MAALPDALRASMDPEALQELLHRCVRGERNAARCLESTLEWRREHDVDEVSSHGTTGCALLWLRTRWPSSG